MPKILIVDDDKFTRSVLETIFGQDRTFASLGVEILTAQDGQAALALYREHQPDAVVTDLLMPKLDGFGLCKEIRASPSGSGTHLAVISGVHRDRDTAGRLEREFGASFFAKPYQLRDMTRHVAEKLAEGPRVDEDDDLPEIEIEGASPNDDIATHVSMGELSERKLPAVLMDLLEAEATGRLLVRRGKVTKNIELLYGHPVAVSSSLRDETLGQLLLAAGVISDAQHKRALQNAAKSKKRIGEALIELGALSPEQLANHLTGQVRHNLVSTLRWPVGTWRFQPEAAGSRSRRSGAIDGLATILTGLKASADIAHPPPYLRAAESRPLKLAARGHQLIDDIARHISPAIKSLWSEGSSIAEMTEAGYDRKELLTAVDVLLLIDALVVDQPGEGTHAGAPAEESGGLSVRDLSEHSQLARLPQPPGSDHRGEDLYDVLFDEGSVMAPLPTGDAPIELPESDGVPGDLDLSESGVIDVGKMSVDIAEKPEAREARRAKSALLREYLRIQGLDHYGVLKIDRTAGEATISAAVTERRSKFSMDYYARFDLGRDYAKLEQLHAAYDEALEVLMEPDKRAAYDSGEPGDEAPGGPPLESEIAFGEAEVKLAGGKPREAIVALQRALKPAPEDATYLATLGWAHYLAGSRQPRAADEARRHLNQALVHNPDSSVAHAYKGIIGAELGDDDNDARFHLERALDVDPSHASALESLEAIWGRAGEARPLEKLYRRLIYRTAGRDSTMELLCWRKLAELYRTELDDPESARIAYESASRLAPDDAALQAAVQDLDSGSPDRFFERSEVLRDHWRRDPTAAGPGVELMRAAEQAARPDAAFLAASALVARGLADDKAEALYQHFRPRFLIRAQRLMDPQLWSRLRHPDDQPELDQLFELIADVVTAAMPLTLDDLEVDETMRIDEEMLPADFVAVRAYVAHLYGVAVPPVYVRSDFRHQIHIGAIATPILLAGDDALAAPERSELGFRLGRAMTYLFPGRTVAGSRPSRMLVQAVLAAWQLATPGHTVPDEDGGIAQMRDLLVQLPADRLDTIRGLVGRITQTHKTLNLSRWTRAMARTADRAGLLLCGDVPAALRFANEMAGSSGLADLVDFAISRDHLALRSMMGLSIDV